MAQVAERPLVDVRADFPVLAREFDGKRVAYLDSAATSQRPRQVIEAMDSFQRNSYAPDPPRRLRAGARVDRRLRGRARADRHVRELGAGLLDLHPNATESINLVAYSWGREHVGAGDEVLITEMEHHSNIVPWQILCEETGATLRYLTVSESGELSLDELDEALAGGRVKIVARRPRLERARHDQPGRRDRPRELAPPAPSRWWTALRPCPSSRWTSRELDVDFYAWTGHKALGPTLGMLHGRRELLTEMRPFLAGGHMIKRVERRVLVVERPALEVRGRHLRRDRGRRARCRGRLPVRAGHGQRPRARARSHRLRPRAAARGRGRSPSTGRRDAGRRGGVVSFAIEGIHPHDIAELCDREAVCIRAGHHCAQPLMRCLGVGATARASFHVYNSRDEVDRLVDALVKAREVFGL